MGRPWSLISAGVVVILGALFYLATLAITVAVALTLSGLGLWLLIVAVVKWILPTKDEVEAPITAGWGALTLALGLAGILSIAGYPLYVVIVGLAVVLGILMIVAAFRMWPRRAPVPVKAGSQ